MVFLQHKSCIVLICMMLFGVDVVLAQPGTDAFESTFGFGKIVRNHPDIPDINTGAVTATLSFTRHFNGYKPWHRYYNFPRVGISLTEGVANNKDVIGSFTGIMSEMTFEKKLGAHFVWGPRLSFGGAWFTNPYNENTNEGNVIIGSHITFLTSVDVIMGYKINSGLLLTGRVSLLHASNSHFTLPNVGMNMPLFAIGARYSFKNEKTVPQESFVLPEFKKIRFNFRVALGVNESGSSTAPVNGPKYPIYLASATISKMFSPVNKVYAGIEEWYNKGSYDFIVSQEFYDDNRHAKASSVALVFGHEFLFGRWGLLTTAGLYLYNPFYKDRQEINELGGFKTKLKSIVPGRLGMQYYVKNTNFHDNKNLFFGIYIKTNFGQADFLESGVGYVF